jgi:hypothetical protein
MAIKIWGAGTGGGADGMWTTASNWSGNTLPINGDSIVLNGSGGELLTGPSSDVTIQDFTVTSAETATFGIYGDSGGAIYLTGNMDNQSPYGLFILPRVGFEGVTSVVGQWQADNTVSRVNVVSGNPSNRVASFNIENLIFDQNNYINFRNVDPGGFGAYGVTICRPSIGAGVRPFISIKFGNSTNGIFNYSFNMSNTRILSTTFILEDTIFSLVDNSLFNLASSTVYTSSIVCNQVNISTTQSIGDIFNASGFAFSTPISVYPDFIFEAPSGNLNFTMTSSQFAGINTAQLAPPGDLRAFIMVGFSAPGDVKITLKGKSYLALNLGKLEDSFLNNFSHRYSIFNYNLSGNSSINVYDSSCVGLFVVNDSVMGNIYSFPSINLYDRALLAGKPSTGLCSFFGQSRVAPELYQIEKVQDPMSFQFFVAVVYVPSAFQALTDDSNKNSYPSSF